MAGRPRQRRSREDYQRGLPGYHDPTAGMGGSRPALSALTARAWLAGFGLVFSAVLAILLANAEFPVLAWIAVAAAVIAAVDLVWVLHRKRRGEPG